MFENIVKQISNDKTMIINVGLFTHNNPDYDAVCSTLTLAKRCNGGGYPNRCAGRFFNTSYEEVLSYINDLFYKLNYGNSIIRTH